MKHERLLSWLTLGVGGLLGCTGQVLSSVGDGVNDGDGKGGNRTGGSNQGGSDTGGNGGDAVPAVECTFDSLPSVTASVRLNDRQFRNSVQKLFPFAVDVGSKFPVTSLDFGYTNFLDANQMQYAQVPDLLETAESIAMQAIARVSDILPCTPAGNEAACARQFAEQFASKAFRRPAEKAEVDRLATLYQTVRGGADPLDFNLAIAAIIVNVLQSPQFLYRLELGEAAGGAMALTPHEIASHLSYLFLDGPPDQALLDKAASGELRDPAQIRAQAERLLADALARGAVERFFDEWTGAAEFTFSDRVSASLAANMKEEVHRFVSDLALSRQGGTVAGLLNNRSTFTNRALQQHYGLPVTSADDQEWQPTELRPEMAAGLLAKAQVAAGTAHGAETSVILRGKLVHERLLCVDLGAPPPGATDMNPSLGPDATERDKMDARGAISPCGQCHQYLDNVGIGMEDMDHIGRYRAMYSSGRPVDVKGTVLALGDDEPAFTGTAQLAALLAPTEKFTACVATHWYRNAIGRKETDDERDCHIGGMVSRIKASGNQLRELLLSVTASDGFRLRTNTTQ